MVQDKVLYQDLAPIFQADDVVVQTVKGRPPGLNSYIFQAGDVVSGAGLLKVFYET